MRKKGKSYQKVPPYKRYKASKPSNGQFVEEEEKTFALYDTFWDIFSSVSYCFDIHKN
jgi:hypothetical protein